MLAKSLIWEITDPKVSDKSSMLVGTIHLADHRIEHLIHSIKELMVDYSRIFTEAPLSLATPALLSKKVFVDRNTWKSYWSDRKKAKIRAILLKAYKVNLDEHLSIRPMFVISMLYQRMLEPEKSVAMDQVIWDYAVALNKDVEGLESIEEQVKIMEHMSIGFEYNQLWAFSKNINATRKKFLRLIDFYCLGDIQELFKRTRSTLGPNKDILLYDRNKTLAERIAKHHRSSPSLFTFGAAHLAGQKGVLTLLKHEGFKVKAKLII